MVLVVTLRKSNEKMQTPIVRQDDSERLKSIFKKSGQNIGLTEPLCQHYNSSTTGFDNLLQRLIGHFHDISKPDYDGWQLYSIRWEANQNTKVEC